jgi:uncharacterized protein YggE
VDARPPTPTLYVTGRSEREVVPDRVVVHVHVESEPHRAPQAAIAAAAAARRRILDDLAAAHPDARITDARVTTVPEHATITEDLGQGRTSERFEVTGHRGRALVRLEGPVDRAHALMASAGAHPDAARAVPEFVVSPDLARRVDGELEQEAVRDALARAAGIAEAAGMAVTGILSIGEAATPPPGGDLAVHAMERAYMSVDDRDRLEEALGELRPDPVVRSAVMPLRVTLGPAASG